jgi:hypothetical protein
MSEDIESDYFITLTFDQGQVRFGALPRAWDERNHDIFLVKLPGRPLLFGEWRAKWAGNGRDFNAEIIDFGLRDRGDVANSEAARESFSEQERATVEDLIRKLFASTAAKENVVPFAVPGATFLGKVDFLAGWIRS